MTNIAGVSIMLFLLALLALLVTILVARAGTTPNDVRWLNGSADLTHDEAAVYADHLVRHRTSRLWWGGMGVIIAIALGIILNEGTVTLGTNALGPAGDLLYCLVTGVAAGALLAESYRLRRRPGPVAASLAPRAALPGRGTRRAARLGAFGALALGIVDGVVAPGLRPALLTGAVLVPWFLCELVLRTVRDRARPVLSPRAEHVDARLRAFAAVTVSRLSLAAALSAAGWLVDLDGSWQAGGALAQPVGLVNLAFLIAALVALWHAAPRSRGRRPLLPGDDVLSRLAPPVAPAPAPAAWPTAFSGDTPGSDRTLS